MITVYIKDDGTVDFSDDRNEGLYAEDVALTDDGMDLYHANVKVHITREATV